MRARWRRVRRAAADLAIWLLWRGDSVRGDW
jgi:hypothetical protein